MAITWGSGSGSGNLQYLGIDVAVGQTVATVKIYAKSQYPISYSGIRVSWSGAASGSTVFNHNQSGGQTVLVAAFNVTGSPGQTKTVNVSQTAVYNGGKPSHSRTFTFASVPGGGGGAPDPVTKPYTPGAVTTTLDPNGVDKYMVTAWAQGTVTATTPVDRYRLERLDYGSQNPDTWSFQGNFTYRQTQTSNSRENNQYRYRVAAENSAGRSGWSYGNQVATRPAPPINVVLSRTAAGGLVARWVDVSPFNTEWDVQWHNNIDGFGTVVSIPNAASSHGMAAPNTLAVHTFYVRSKVGARVSEWVASNTLLLLTKPNPPTALDGGVADPDREIVQTWQENAADGSGQTARQLRWKPLDGSGSWTEEAVSNTSVQSVTWPAGKFTTPEGLQVQVRTKGGHASWSDWSATSTYTWAATPVVEITKPAGVYPSPTLTVEWTSTQPQAEWRVEVQDPDGYVLSDRAGSGEPVPVQMPTRLLSGFDYIVSVQSRSAEGLWADTTDLLFSVEFPLPGKVSTEVEWDAERGWATASFTRLTVGAGEAIPDEIDLYRTDGAGEVWELVAEHVPFGAEVVDTEAAVDGSAIWVARSRNINLETEADGPAATTQIPPNKERGYLSAGPGYETVTPLIWDPDTTLTLARPGRQVITLDGGLEPRRVLVDTPEIKRVLSFTGQLTEDRDGYEALVLLPGPHLYRDCDGRKLYGALSETPVERGTKALWWGISFTVEESDHETTYGQVFPA